MSQIFKTYLAVLLTLLMGFSAGGILQAYLSVADAQDCHARIIGELEAGDFYPAVVQSCYKMAEEKGYELEITYYGENGEEGSTYPQSPVAWARIDMHFPFQIAFFGIRQQHTLSGYAR